MAESQFIDVLLVEDSPTDALLAQEALRESSLFRVEHVQRLGPALVLLSERTMSVVLLDLGLPDSQGLETLGKLRRHSPDVPVIILTARDDEELAIHSAQEGAHEYLVKSQLQEGNLRRAIRYVVERHRAEKALRDSERHLRAIIDTTPQSIELISSDGTILKMNVAGLAMLEVDTPADVMGKSIFPFIAPEFLDGYQRFHDAVCQGVAGTFEFDMIGLRGTRRSLRTVSATFSGANDSRSHLSLAQDVTERKKSEAALLLRDRAIQAVTQGIIITDAGLSQNPIMYVSPGFERLTGYSAQEAIGQNCRFLQGAETDPLAVKQLRDAIHSGLECTVEFINYRKDGTPFWNALSISPVKDDGGKLTNFVGVQTDVTSRRQLEEQLRQSQKMDAVGQLAGGVAHDFNNLLTIITGYSELLLDIPQWDDLARDMLVEIKRAANSSAALTRQLLAFSRNQVLSPQVLDLNDVVHDAEKMLARVIGEDLQFSTNLDPALARIKADPGQIEQVLLNLAVNARDAMPQGGSLTIETKKVRLDETNSRLHAGIPPGEYAVLSVTDSGVGMSAEIRQRIFEPFFTTKERGKGTGLGLSVVHGIVKQSDAFLEVDSEPGCGTTFKIFFPRSTAASSAAIIDGDHPELPLGGGTILLVEDDQGVRGLTRRVLRACAYTVLEASNGAEALHHCANHQGKIDLLVTDVVMPGTGGRELADKVTGLLPNIKVLYMSGYTDDAVVRQGVLRDQMNFLQKPFVPAALASKVREVLAS